MESSSIEDLKFSITVDVREKPPSDKGFVISLIIPALFIFIIVILFPIIVGIFISFRNSSGEFGYFGSRFTLTRYYWILFDGGVVTKDFWQFTYQTLFFAVFSLIIEFGIGIWFAKLLNKKFKGRGLARATILIPWALPTIASATIFRYEIFAPADQYGLVNNLLQLFSLRPLAFFGPDAPILFKLPVLVPYDTGLGPPWFPYLSEINITGTMFIAIIIDVWKTTPFLTLLILAVLQIVPEDLDKAADIAGASGWQKFRYVTWPLIKPGVGIALIFRTMDALRVYDAIVVFRDKEVKSMTWQAVDLWRTSQEYGLASVVAIILFIFIIVFYLGISRFTKSETEQSTKQKTIYKKPESKINALTTQHNNTEAELESTLILSESERKIEEFSESKVTWIRLKLKLNKGIFSFSVLFMCLFCAAPFIWVIIRSFRDPYIPQTTFELNNIMVAVMLILFIISLFFTISNLTWRGSKGILFVVSIFLVYGILAFPFIWIIIQSLQNPLLPIFVFVYSCIALTVIFGLLIISFYFILIKFLKTRTNTYKKLNIKDDELAKSSSKELLPNGGVVKTELDSRFLSKSEIKSKMLLFLKIHWKKIVLLCISLIIIFYSVIIFSNWLSSGLTSLGAFQVVFQTSQFTGVSFDRALFNGFVLSGLTVVVVLIIASLIAYALAKFDFSGKVWITAFIFTMTSLPPIIIIIPYFIQTNSVSDFISGNRDLLSLVILIIGIVLIISDIEIYIHSKNYKKKLFVTTLVILIIFFAICVIYISFADLLIVDRSLSSYIILILGIIVLVLDVVIYIGSKILNKRYSGKLFILSLGIIFVLFGGFILFVRTMSDPYDLRDNIFGLVFPYSALNLPLAAFVLQAFFREIPEDLWKAAKVDGASNFQIFRKIILPLTIPGIFTCAILVFIASWNELLFAQIWLVNDINHTVPRAILRFVQSPLSLTADWNTNIALMAATTTATVPLVILVLIFQKKIISGLTRGAVKG